MTGHRVLVVEDNDTTAQFVRQQLVEGGLLPEVVKGGLEGLRKAHFQPFALAVVDVDIKAEPDGVETANWLRHLYGIPVVVFSMQADSELRSKAATAAPAGYLVRPEAGELSGVISSLLSGRLWPERATDLGRSLDPYQGVRIHPASHSRGTAASLHPGFAELSGREWQIILDLIETPSALAVAQKRQRSPHTVHNHLKSIFRKLHVHSVAELLSLMIRISRQVPVA